MSAISMPAQPERAPEGIWGGYTSEPWPLGGYLALVAAYLTGTSALLISASKSNRIPKRINNRDILLMGVATHKLTRIITKDWVTSPLRAPFTRNVRNLGGGELSDESRGTGLQRAIGDLITCPWCSGPWVATALLGGYVFKPKVTRAIASTLTAVAISDYLHHAWDYTRASTKRRVESTK